jgi:DNA repair exonuclease SbcCD nuclease subunit
MANIVLISDIHMGIRNSSKEWLENQEDYFENFFIPLIENYEKEDSYLIVAGDIFDNRQSINVLVLHKTINIFKKLSERFKEIHIIAGNHDVFLKSSNEITSLDGIANISNNIFLYKDPEMIEIDKTKFFMVPWINDKVKEVEVIKSQNKKADYLVCHTEVKGFYYNTKVRVKDGNDISVYKGYKRVFAGHFHYRQNKGNLYYLGSPLHFTRADIDDKKGIYVLDTQTEKLELFENNHSPEFTKIKVNDVLNMTLEEVKDITRNNYVDIYTDDEFISKYNIHLLMKKLTEVRSIKVNIIELERKINEVVATSDKKFSVVDLCETYMDDNDFEDTEKEKISDYVKNIYNKVAV